MPNKSLHELTVDDSIQLTDTVPYNKPSAVRRTAWSVVRNLIQTTLTQLGTSSSYVIEGFLNTLRVDTLTAKSSNINLTSPIAKDSGDLDLRAATGANVLLKSGSNTLLQFSSGGLQYGVSGPKDFYGSGSPEGSVTAPVSSTYRQVNGANSSTFWYKGLGTGNTGWRRIATLTHANVKDYGALGDGLNDDYAAIQAALDDNPGESVYMPIGVYLVSDTLYVPPATRLFGETFGDNYKASVALDLSKILGTRIKTTGAGTARIRTDIALPATNSTTLVDSATTAVIMGLGEGVSFHNFTLETDAQNGWTYGFHLPSIRRVKFSNIETVGNFTSTGCLIDCTWSADTATTTGNLKLLDLWSGTYNRVVYSGNGPNETSFMNCWFQGGQWGMKVKGTNRTDISANLWSPGGCSDLTFFDCRFGSTPTGTAPNWGMDNGGFYADTPASNNWYFYGCSFRASAYSIFLDRVSNVTFHMYGEFRPDRTITPINVNYTVDALGIVDEAYTGEWSSVDNPVIKKLYLTRTTRIDPITEQVRHNTIFTTSTGSCNAEAFGFDEIVGKAYIKTYSITGVITAGQTITQAAGQSVGGGFYMTDRCLFVNTVGQSTFATPIRQNLNHVGLGSVIFGGNFNSESIQSRGSSLSLGATGNVSINTEGGQINLYTNQFGTGGLAFSRLRIDPTAISHYQGADLGLSARRWGVLYASDINLTNAVPLTQGGTGATSASAARTALGLGSAALTSYEFGTWTPVIQGSSTAGVNSYSNQTGEYWKVGKKVFLTGRIALSALGTAGNAMAGNVTISGLPFAITQSAISSTPINNIIGMQNLIAGDNHFFQTATGTVLSMLRARISAGASAVTSVPVTDLTDTTQFRFQVEYLAAT